MKIVLIILLIIIALVALLLIIALFGKKAYAIRRDIIINKPKAEVFNFLKFNRNHDHFNKWIMADPKMKKEIRGTDGMAGSVYAWDSEMKQVGQGEQQIKSIADGQRIDMEIRFFKPFEGLGYVYLKTESIDENQTKVVWSMESKVKYPMNIALILFNLEAALGKDMDTSLEYLKDFLEN